MLKLTTPFDHLVRMQDTMLAISLWESFPASHESEQFLQLGERLILTVLTRDGTSANSKLRSEAPVRRNGSSALDSIPSATQSDVPLS
jgi:hypothetical protein